jgi:YhcH/YjgK/YiaL family protein
MITDVLQNAGLYEGLNEKFTKAFNYLRETDFFALDKGKYEVDGDSIFAIVNEFETQDRSECKLEAHKKHIDIQYIVKGTELFGYTPNTGQKPVEDYDEVKDVAFYKDNVSYLRLEAGMFIIFYPSDLHQPEVREFEPVTVKKVVVKIKI